MKRLIFSSVLVLFAASTYTQSPIVTGVEPHAQRINVVENSDIVVYFDTPIDIVSFDNPNTFKVFGRWSGPMTGAISLEDGDQTVRFTPSENFMNGEWISIFISRSIMSAGGVNMEIGYSWGFWIRTLEGSINQEEIAVISVQDQSGDPTIAYGAYAGDINNDGFSDLSVVNEATDDVRLFLNDGTGMYDDFVAYPLPEGNTPSPSEGADFNSDGQIDMAIANTINDKVSVLMGDGVEGYLPEEAYTVGQAVRGIGVLDINGDGFDDIVTANRTGNNLSILINDGTGSFAEAVHLNTEADQETAIAVADINEDGILDLFVGGYLSEDVLIMLGDGNGSFTMSDIIDIDGRPWMLGAGDVNGDGHVDVVSANSSTSKAMVILCNGDGTFGTPVYYNSSSFPLAIDLGDIDGDGDLDMMSSNYGSGTYYLFRNSGDGTFQGPTIYNAGTAGSCTILHDRDNDGDMDITGIDEVEDLIFLFENPGVPISIEDQVGDKNKVIRMSPNPAKDLVEILFDPSDSDQSVINIRDISGKLMEEIYLSDQNEKIQISVTEYQAGMYVVEQVLNGKIIGSAILNVAH